MRAEAGRLTKGRPSTIASSLLNRSAASCAGSASSLALSRDLAFPDLAQQPFPRQAKLIDLLGPDNELPKLQPKQNLCGAVLVEKGSRLRHVDILVAYRSKERLGQYALRHV